MKIRAILRLRNNSMIAAREKLKFSQFHVAELCFCSVSLIGRLERLDYPRDYDDLKIEEIARVLMINPDEVMPCELANRTIQSKYEVIRDIDTERLLAYTSARRQRLLLPSPEVIMETKEQAEQINESLECLSYREREIIKLRFGLGDGFTYTLTEVGRIFRVSRERLRMVEARALRKLRSHPNYGEQATFDEASKA